jgi:hypothetical protein
MAAFPELNNIYGKTLELSNLSYANWDGGACEPIDPHSIAKGLQLLETLSLFTIPQAVEPRPDGRIQYRWRNDKGDLILEVVPHRDRFIYQFIPLYSIQPTQPRPVTSVSEFIYQILVPFLLPLKPITNPIENRSPIYQETLPNPL